VTSKDEHGKIAMGNGSEIQALLDALETLADAAEGKRTKWRDVWSEIKNIGQVFKESRFPTAQDRQAAWHRFQSIVERIKISQEQARHEFDEKVRESERHLEQIRSYVWKATPSSEYAETILSLVTGAFLIKLTLDAFLGPFDERKFELQRCSEALKEGWSYLSEHKGEMLGKDKKEAFDALSSASDSLGKEWDIWKEGRAQAVEHYKNQKQEAWEARQGKREAWEARMRENISKLEGRLDQLESALEHRQNNLSKLKDMRDSARSEFYREQVDAWVEDEHDRIDEIEKKIDQIKAWISETETKLQ